MKRREAKRYEPILRDNASLLLDEHHGGAEIHAFMVALIIEGVRELEGNAAADHLAKIGLDRLHECLDPARIEALQEYIDLNARERLLRWTAGVCRHDLDMDDPFFVQELIMVRINYPFERVRRFKIPGSDPANLRSVKDDPLPRKSSGGLLVRLRARLDPRARKYPLELRDPNWYHRNAPLFARAHGPHIDTWYGHSFGGINFWWAIAGVTEQSSMCMYPGLFGYRLEPDERSMYLRPGVVLPRPQRLRADDGALFVFNSEMLHSTQLNVSGKTRIVMTTRVNPGTPSYDRYLHWHFERWYVSTDIAAGRLEAREFSAHLHPGVSSQTRRYARPQVRRIQVPEAEGTAICSLERLRSAGVLDVRIDDRPHVLVDGPAGPRLFRGICPHVGVLLKDGHFDGRVITCPGHGIEFDTSTGKSHCGLFRIPTRAIAVVDGEIRLGRTRAAPAHASAADAQ